MTKSLVGFIYQRGELLEMLSLSRSNIFLSFLCCVKRVKLEARRPNGEALKLCTWDPSSVIVVESTGLNISKVELQSRCGVKVESRA